MADAEGTDLFSPGASIDTPPAGVVEREAIDSLRGYAYQIGVSTLAWIDLDESGRIYLEIAEDYASVAGQALEAVQVKDSVASGSVTLNTPAVRDAVEAFVDLVARNKRHSVELRFLTTSPIGTEHKLADRPAGEAGLVYWRRAAAGADAEPLRAMLTEGRFAPAVIEFVNARNNDELRRDLLQKVHWDCGAPDLSIVRRELEERLIVFGRDKFNLGTVDARPLADVLMYHVLKKSTLKDRAERVPNRAELYRAIDAATQVGMPRRAVGAIAQLAPALAGALGGNHPSETAFSAQDTGWIVPGNDLPAPRGIIPRRELAARIGVQLTIFRGRFLLQETPARR